MGNNILKVFGSNPLSEYFVYCRTVEVQINKTQDDHNRVLCQYVFVQLIAERKVEFIHRFESEVSGVPLPRIE